MRNRKELWLEDGDGNVMILKRKANLLVVRIDDAAQGTSFNMTATHVGKMLEFVVDMFFPGGADDESTKSSQHSGSK